MLYSFVQSLIVLRPRKVIPVVGCNMGFVTAILVIRSAVTILKKIMNVADICRIFMKNISNFKITKKIEKK